MLLKIIAKNKKEKVGPRVKVDNAHMV